MKSIRVCTHVDVVLLDLLHEEGKYVEIQTSLVRMESGMRNQRTYRLVNEKIMKLWEKFNDGEITSSQLLSNVAKIYGPQEQHDEVENEERQF